MLQGQGCQLEKNLTFMQMVTYSLWILDTVGFGGCNSLMGFCI